MSDYVLSCCTPIDTTPEWVEERNIICLPFHFSIGNVQYDDDFWSSWKPEQMYARMLAGEDSKTSQVSVGEYTAHFKKYLDEGKDVLHLTLSSGISGTHNSAMVAAMEIKEQYPDRKLIVMDSLAASAGFGLLMDRLAALRDEGKTIDELATYVRKNRLLVHHWFFSSDLTFYIKGGRVTKTAGFFGNLLNINPLLHVDNMGKLIPREKIRTKRKVIERIVEKMEAYADGGHDYDQPCYISHSACLQDAEAVKTLIEQRFPKMKDKVEIYNVGPMIGCHTGPGTVALFFWGDRRKE